MKLLATALLLGSFTVGAYEKASCLDLRTYAAKGDLNQVNRVIQQGMDEYQLELMVSETVEEVTRVDDLLRRSAPNLKKYLYTYCTKNAWIDIADAMAVGVTSNFSK